jgi:hypothetical protein
MRICGIHVLCRHGECRTLCKQCGHSGILTEQRKADIRDLASSAGFESVEAALFSAWAIEIDSRENYLALGRVLRELHDPEIVKKLRRIASEMGSDEMEAVEGAVHERRRKR